MTAYGIVGGACSGKTTLIRELARQLDMSIVHEYATRFIERNGGISGPADQLHISHAQKEMERELRERGQPFITECTIFTGLVYHAENFPHTVGEMYADFFDMDVTYEKLFWLEHLGFYEPNGIRYQKDVDEARRIGERLYAEACRFAKEVYVIPAMPVQERARMIMRVLAEENIAQAKQQRQST